MSDHNATMRIDGPDGYWSPDEPPSRGQLAAIAGLALTLLGEPPPRSRLDATALIVQLRGAVLEQTPSNGSDPF